MARASIARTLVLAFLATGCTKAEKPIDELRERCTRAVSKMTLEEQSNSTGGVGIQEAMIRGAAKGAAVSTCVSEGLSKAQAECFEKIHDMESLFRVADCPAIEKNLPSWLSVPPKETREFIIQKMKERELRKTRERTEPDPTANENAEQTP